MFAVVRVVFSRSLGFAAKQQRTFAVSNSLSSERRSYRLVVVGGGTAGCAIGSKFGSHFGNGKVAIVEPSDVSFGQHIRVKPTVLPLLDQPYRRSYLTEFNRTRF